MKRKLGMTYPKINPYPAFRLLEARGIVSQCPVATQVYRVGGWEVCFFREVGGFVFQHADSTRFIAGY